MGRGQAKAKQVKVARQLKYNGGGTDLNRLRRGWASERKRRAPTTTTRMPSTTTTRMLSTTTTPVKRTTRTTGRDRVRAL